jgi:hypothetical protein
MGPHLSAVKFSPVIYIVSAQRSSVSVQMHIGGSHNVWTPLLRERGKVSGDIIWGSVSEWSILFGTLL